MKRIKQFNRRIGVLLAIPPSPVIRCRWDVKFDNKTMKYKPYPTRITYATSVLKQEGFDAHMIDAFAEELTHRQFADRLKELNPDVLIWETTASSWGDDIRTMRMLKKIKPNLLVGTSGYHASAVYKDCVNEGYDFAIVGECDYSIRDLAFWLSGELKGFPKGVYARGHKFVPMPLIQNLDELPWPERDELPMYQYNDPKLHGFNVVMVASRGCPWGCSFCLTPEMPIITNNGLHQITDLKEGNQVLSHDGNFHKIERIVSRPYNGEIIKIKAMGIPYDVKLTPNHEIWGVKRRYYRRSKDLIPYPIRAVELKITKTSQGFNVSDFLAIPRMKEVKDIESLDLTKVLEINAQHKRCFCKYTIEDVRKVLKLSKEGMTTRKIAKETGISKSRVHSIINFKNPNDKIDIDLQFKDNSLRFYGAKTSIPKEIKLDDDFLRLCGYYLSEGNVHTIKNRPNSKVLILTFGRHEKDYIENAKELIIKIFHIEPMISDTKSALQIMVNSSIVACIFETLFSTGASNKRIPFEWLFLPRIKIESLLCGLFRGDAHINETTKHFSFDSVSKILSEQVWIMLCKLGIYTSLRILPMRKSNINNRIVSYHHTPYCVRSHSIHDIKEIYRIMDKQFSIKDLGKIKSRHIVTNDYILVPIIKKEREIYDGIVHNLTIENTHTYNVFGFIVSNCTSPVYYGNPNFRMRDPKLVVDEMEFLWNKYKPDEIYFDDDNFSVNEKHVEDICNELRKRNLKIKWNCMGDALISDRLLDIMKNAGCTGVTIGAESADNEVLKHMGKPIKREDIKRFVYICKRIGLRTHLAWVMGLPYSSKESDMETIKYAINLPSDTMQFSLCMAFPGTGMWKWADENNYLITKDWRYISGNDKAIVDLPGYNHKEIEKMQRYGMIQWHRKMMFKRPDIVLFHLYNLYKYQGVKKMFKVAFRSLKLVFEK